MKCLTVRQPHAHLIEIGEKTIELRSWRTAYRGNILICAAARPDYELAYPCGVTICVARLADITPFAASETQQARSRWRAGLWSWHLTDVRRVPQIAIKGALSLFAAPADIERRLTTAVG